MKKSGFTLIELLGAIILLGIITLITVPVIDNSLKKSKQTLYDNKIDYIVSSAKTWVVDNIKQLPSEDGQSITITIQQLKSVGYLTQSLINPKTDKEISNNSTIVITRKLEQFEYTVNIIDKATDENVVN